MPLIEILYSLRFQEDSFEFNDLIYDCLEASYLAIPFAIRKF